MHLKTSLPNGVTVLHGEDCDGKVVFHYLDGRCVSTTWTQLAQIERLADELQQAYDLLLSRVQCPHSCAHVPVDILARIDETLYRTRTAVQETGSLFDAQRPARRPGSIRAERPTRLPVL